MNKKIKILIIQGYAYQRGGITTFLKHLVKHIDKSCFEPIVLFLSQGELVDEFQSMNIPVKIICSGRLSNAILAMITIIRIMWLIHKERVEIVFSNEGREHIYGGIAAYLTGIPATFFWHAFFSIRSLSKITLLVPGTIFVNNSETKTLIESRGRRGSTSKCKLVPLGTEITEYRIVNEKLKVEFGIENKVPIITQVALLVHYKGQRYFIESMPRILEHFSKTKFLIVGETPFWASDLYEQELRNRVKELKIEQSVIFTGFRKDALEIIHLSDIIVHPITVPELFEFTVLEAMAASKPVIVGKIGAPKSFIEDGVDGVLISPNSSDAIAESVIWLLKNPDIRKTIGQNARKKVKKCFSVEIMVKKIEKELQEIVK